MPYLRSVPGGVQLTLRVQPRAGRNAIAGPSGTVLKVRIAAAPVEGAANEELTRFLSSVFRIPRSRISFRRGAASRDKVVLISDLSEKDARVMLEAAGW